jgi:hypothetical protein
VWKFVNSSFGIWVLATVVVGALSWGYTKWDSNRAETAAFRANITKLDVEIASRIQGAYDELSAHPNGMDAFLFHHLVRGNQFNVYKEFEGRDTRSLMIELSFLVADPERREIHHAIPEVVRLFGLAPRSASGSGETTSPNVIAQALAIVTGQLALPRWRLLRRGAAA